jgi:hypothetical protein
MRITHRIGSLLLLLAPLFARAGGIAGSGPTVCTAYESSPLIFRARVLQTRSVPYPPIRGGTSYPKAYAHLQVLEVFKGDPGPEITVLGYRYMFSNGGEVLVYADPPVSPPSPLVDSEPVSQILARTGSLADPGPAADLVWLRAYPSAPPTAIISGSVSMGLGGGSDIPTISVSLTGPTTLSASTAADHTYAFKDLPPGAYTVTAVLPAGYSMFFRNPTTVTVAAKGCAEVDFSLHHDTQQPAR